MKELYKVRNISLSVLDCESESTCMNLTCEFGAIIEEEGILFLETYVFDEKTFQKIFKAKNLSHTFKGQMITFDNIEIEIPLMSLNEMTTHENKLTYKCIDYITVKRENFCLSSIELKDDEPNHGQLFRVDFWGLDLLLSSNNSTILIVSNVPFEIKFEKNNKMGNLYACFPTNKLVTHNTITDELFSLFRESLIGYLSLINGASVQIIKESYYGYFRIYSYNRIENVSRSRYLCGNNRAFRFSPILFDFDNYVRWNKVLNLNKFISHLCSAQQLLNVEDRAFILILVFEGLCKKYIGLLNEDIVPKNIITQETFDIMKKEILEILNHQEVSSDAFRKLKSKIDNLNTTSIATLKFRIVLEHLNMLCTPEIKKLIKSVRSTLVHEAELKDFEDYLLLSELIREVILRLINSKVKRYSDLDKVVFFEKEPGLSFIDYVEKYNMDVTDQEIIPEFDKRIKLWMYHPCKLEKKKK